MTELSGAVAVARDRIRARARDPLLQAVPGLADDLHSIGEALAALELGARVLARVYLSERYGYSLSRLEYRYVLDLSGEVSPAYLVELER